MANSRSGYHDRRGFDGSIQFFIAMIPASILLMIFYNWKIGLALTMISCVYFITLEAASACPDNNPLSFIRWQRTLNRRRPVLLCLGDSLTHGNVSASITPQIPSKLCKTLGLPTPSYGLTFSDPLWVVNAGQNSITSHTILHERLHTTMGVEPDYVMIMIGTNDVRAMYKPALCKRVMQINELPDAPTMRTLERNLTGILCIIQEKSPKVEIGLCTLPPMGEDLKSRANMLVRKANEIIERVAASAGDKVTLLPVFAQLESVLEKQKRQRWSLPIDYWMVACALQTPIYHLFPMFSTWNMLSKPLGFHVMSDGLHLNERGRDEVVDLVVDWLNRKNIAKVIAVKSKHIS
jgi:lysophospholipase L1-like esterase